MDFNYLIPILFLGAANGLILSWIFFQRRKGHPFINKLLSLLILIQALSLTEAVLILSGVYKHIPSIVSATFPLTFLTGPILYFYVLFSVSYRTGFKPIDLIHLLPFLIGIWDQLPLYAMDAQIKVNFIDEILSSNVYKASSKMLLMMLFKMAQLGFYLVLTQSVIRKNRAKLKEFSSGDSVFNFEWLQKLTILFATYVVINLLVFIGLEMVG